ncbi:YciI family protein [Winogradskyella undariae]|uniref:YciI family protein n=1 Tax=Winogradskyella undariae TaxID=1285465 RepID=UPI00211C6CFE|nr:hypothetical protein [Winogradskyella undariae]
MVKLRQVLFSSLVVCSFFGCKNETTTEVNAQIPQVVNSKKPELESDKVLKEQKISVADLKKKLAADGFKVFDYVDKMTQDTIIMQQYFIAFLKEGPIRNQNEEEAALLQEEHLAHLSKMYSLGLADISGPFDDDGNIRGVTIYNVPTLKIADSLSNSDPMVKEGRLTIEIHPWWAAKGHHLR